MSEFTLSDLAATISERAKSLPEMSYTASLLELGTGHCARKFGEESVEAIVAALEGNGKALVSEAADVLYHLLVLLQSCGVGFEPVMAELGRRSGKGGLAEKAGRAAR